MSTECGQQGNKDKRNRAAQPGTVPWGLGVGVDIGNTTNETCCCAVAISRGLAPGLYRDENICTPLWLFEMVSVVLEGTRAVPMH